LSSRHKTGPNRSRTSSRERDQSPGKDKKKIHRMAGFPVREKLPHRPPPAKGETPARQRLPWITGIHAAPRKSCREKRSGKEDSDTITTGPGSFVEEHPAVISNKCKKSPCLADVQFLSAVKMTRTHEISQLRTLKNSRLRIDGSNVRLGNCMNFHSFAELFTSPLPWSRWFTA